MVHETPALYERVVRPYITAFPPSRTQWYVESHPHVSHNSGLLPCIYLQGWRISSMELRKRRKWSSATRHRSWATSSSRT